MKNALRAIGIATLGVCAVYGLYVLTLRAASGIVEFQKNLNELAQLSEEDEYGFGSM